MSGRILKFDISDCDSGLISRGKCALLVMAGLTQGARRALGISMNTLRRHDILRTITPTYYLVIPACRLRKSRHGQRGRAATETRNISRKACPEQCRRDAKAAKVTARGLSSRANARDLRKISPFGRNDKEFFLAYFAPWRESIPLFEYFSSTEHLRRPRKFSRIVVRRTRKGSDIFE